MMDRADTPRQGDRDGRGNLSEAALIEFIDWFLEVCLDQVRFMSALFDLDGLRQRLGRYVAQDDRLKPEAIRILEEALLRGHIERGDVAQVTGLASRSARRLLAEVSDVGLLDSDSPRGSLHLKFLADALDVLFPRLFPVA